MTSWQSKKFELRITKYDFEKYCSSLKSSNQKSYFLNRKSYFLGHMCGFGLRQGALRSLLNEALHHGCPHYLLAHGAFLDSAPLGKHRQQGLHLQHTQHGLVRGGNAISFQEVFLDGGSDVAIAKRI